MELYFSTVLPSRQAFSVLNFPSKPTQISIISLPKPGSSNSNRKFVNFPKKFCSCRVKGSSPNQPEEKDTEKAGKQKKDAAFQWRSVFLGKTSIESNSGISNKSKVKDTSGYLDDEGSMDWCVRARRLALKSIEARGFSYKLERMVTPKKKKKRKKRKTTGGKGGKLDMDDLDSILEKLRSDDEQKEEEEDVELLAFDVDDEDDEGEEKASSKNDQNALKSKIAQFAGGVFEEKRAKAKAAFVERLSQFSGPSNRKMEISLNKQIVEADTAEEVLGVISEIVTAVAKGLSPSPLSPLNIATALHRIAKNMEKVQMVETRKLGFTRQREMSLLVGIAMTALPNCTAQGVSNIAWALSKIGGELLYQSEMDRIADIAVTKVDDFNAQNVANVAGAYASMRHASPDLFTKLVFRAREVVKTFNEQEITQFLWACATMNVCTDHFLDALDTVFHNQDSLVCDDETEKGIEDDNEEEIEDGNENEVSSESWEDIEDLKSVDNFLENIGSYDESTETCALNFTRDQIGNIAWSYAVLGQTGRPFFKNIWGILTQFVVEQVSDQFRKDVLFASQVYIANQCLKVGNSSLALEGDLEEKIYCVGRAKRFNIKTTSSFQKEVGRLLVSTGLNWVKEYSIDGYTVDAVLVDKKVALEIDGPTHFSRNLGTPLGHTMMKRWYITAAGWKLISLSYYEWEALRGEFEQMEYLRKILGINEVTSPDEAIEGKTKLYSSADINV